jgi:two-component system, LytTR family, sensor histidine kinase AlgZ
MPSAARVHHTRSPAYWRRVAVVGLTTALGLTVLFTVLGRTTSVPVMLKHSLVHSSILAGLCGALLPGIRRRIAQASSWVQWAVTIPSLLGLAAVGTALACALIMLTGGHETFWPAFTFTLPINALITMTLGVGMSLYEAQRARLNAVTLELRTRELEAERDRKLALQVRLASLESRLQPHFLFNTLNAISSLIQDDPDHAERTVERLAALLRFSLDASERGLVPLADELKIVGDYLEIERARLGSRLTFTIDVDPEAAGREVPPLTIQTLVENSVKHAIAPRPAGGRIRVAAALAGDRLVLSVWDDGPGFPAAAMRPGHGLESLQTRLATRFGAAVELTIAGRDGGTLVTVTVPRAEV